MVNKVYLEDSRTLNLDLRADPLGEYIMVYCETVLYFLTYLVKISGAESTVDGGRLIISSTKQCSNFLDETKRGLKIQGVGK